MPVPLLAIGAVAGIAGGLMGKGKKVKVPDMPRLDFNAVQTDTIRGNIGSLKDLGTLASGVNDIQQRELDRLTEQAIPGFGRLRDQTTDILGRMQKGELPDDVINQIINTSAARGISGGVGGSGFSRNLTARDLGLTSLNLVQQGVTGAMQWLQTARQNFVAPQFNVGAMFMTPAQRADLELRQNTAQFNRNLAAAQEAAKPNPTMAALGGTLQGLGGLTAGAGLGDILNDRQFRREQQTTG